MSLAEIAPMAQFAPMALRGDASARPSTAKGGCPFHPAERSDTFADWLEHGLHCAAGKREFKLGRYFVSRVKNGTEFRSCFDAFRREVADMRRTGFLAIFIDQPRYASVEEELRFLGQAMLEAGGTDNAAELVAGRTMATPIDVICPVTGEETAYEFFSVAFSRNAGDTRDPLYDPSLSAPFTAVNTTSDAFAFARLVHDQSMRVFDRAPYEMVHDRDAVELLFRRCITAWQNMSITTISNYSRIAVDQTRGVHLTEDRKAWVAAHNDPVFAELKKCPHIHEMPITYAARLCAKWSATLFEGKHYEPGRDGQSGGVALLGTDERAFLEAAAGSSAAI